MDASAAAAAAGGGLQRSEISFRRTGSSGLVWDDKFLGELAKIKPASQDPNTTTITTDDDVDPPRSSSATSSDPKPTVLLQRSRSQAAVEIDKQGMGYKAMKEPSPSIDPPSPKVSGCGALCSVFGEKKRKKRGAVVGKRRV